MAFGSTFEKEHDLNSALGRLDSACAVRCELCLPKKKTCGTRVLNPPPLSIQKTSGTEVTDRLT